MICATCGTENRADRKFCLRCGSALAAGCPSCGAANEREAGFCGECGQPLAGAIADRPVPATPAGATGVSPQPIAERRLVSVLFADLVGFTSLTDGRDPEETRDLLSRYFEIARDVIERYGGTVEKFIGDAVMAVWGAPAAFEDDAERAVRAGLELVDAVRALGPSIQARAGVLTGEAAVSIGVVGEGMVAGDLVNTASRLQSVAPPGSVLVGEATKRAASQAIVFEEAGEQLLKGKVAPVPAFRAARVVAERGGRGRSDTLEAPFVGRDAELRLLKDQFHQTSREQRARLVSILGPAGIGKSRLAWEFLKYIDGLVETVWWHDGRSPAHGQGITFWALGEMVRGRCGLLESDDVTTTRQKVGEAVERWVPDPDERRWVESALLTLLGAEDAAPGRTEELFSAWRTFFERIATEGTVVMVFEDLQWADPGLLAFIDHLLEWSKARPIYIVTLARPELLDELPGWGAGKRNFINLSLEPLAEASMRELLAGLVPGLPTTAASTIIARADGIPLYAVETVRMLVSEGRLRAEDGAYLPVGDLSRLAVPETLQALIAARLDGLEPTDRSLLQSAAVIGQVFTVPGLAAVSGIVPDEVELRLRHLVKREMLSIEADPRSPERGQYGFVQGLIREVAYNTLARADRKTRHLAAARFIEALGEDELAGVLAGHYVAAFRNAPEGPEASALAAQARVALRAAADRAEALGSQRQAAAFLEQALEVTDDDVERAVVTERAAMALTTAGDTDAARRLYAAAEELYRRQGDRLGIVRVATGMSTALHNLGQPRAAAEGLEAALGQAAGLEAEADVVRGLVELGRAYANGGDPRALETSERASIAAERLDAMPVIVEALINRALVLGYANRDNEANALLRGIVPLTVEHGLGQSRIRALNNLAAGVSMDEPLLAREVTHQGMEVSTRVGDRSYFAQFVSSAIFWAAYFGDWDEADRLIVENDAADIPTSHQTAMEEVGAFLEALRGDERRAIEIRARVLSEEAAMDDPRVAVWSRVNQARLDDIAGRHEAAFQGAIEGARLGLEGSYQAAFEATIAALWSRDLARAREALGLHLALPIRGRFIGIERLTLASGVQALEGDPGRAAAGFREAWRGYRDVGVLLSLGYSLITAVATLPPGHPDAVAAEAEARELFERLGARALLDRLDEAHGRAVDASRTRPASGESVPV